VYSILSIGNSQCSKEHICTPAVHGPKNPAQWRAIRGGRSGLLSGVSVSVSVSAGHAGRMKEVVCACESGKGGNKKPGAGPGFIQAQDPPL